MFLVLKSTLRAELDVDILLRTTLATHTHTPERAREANTYIRTHQIQHKFGANQRPAITAAFAVGI